MSDGVLMETRGAVGVVTLNRPKALNALNLEMCRQLHPQLDAWAADPAVKAVVIQGAGGRAFCAGGDVRAVAASVAESPRGEQERVSREFFRAEYALNHRIHHFGKPYVSLVDGVCMGGGVGLSIHGAYRVVTEKLVLAMPETALGLFPDVGGGWFLPRFPGESGTYLGLTGARCSAADAMWLGYGTHHVESARLASVLEALVKAEWGTGPASAVVERILAGFHADAGTSVLATQHAAMDRCFAAERVEDIQQALEAEGSAWAQETWATLVRMCPTSLKVSLRQLRMGRTRDYDEMVAVEYRLSQSMTARADFREGIRAVLVDKDNKPRWHPGTLGDVTEADVEACFAPRAGDEFVVSSN
ncbi:enoyl-CoA hydratase/isomerase family protein [Myxococcus sp. CA051A]|uniref:3-hydroxyisobutyryl-CoA hydrolase n=1 Tax=Myxococcus llanfairpwllgwyngyllgogerychwyrndrobwllllantysiliogogogochensis TaxID=2590453 RepID=A0A540WLW9_9BACT|nr:MULTISPECIES: enoyl-CoA hydratase/isomerase family protein [Myxococcus]NTX04002.1 enoyl-CoA hydratase/isomerase family protein [Myxococcus sp. CA040A]NTX61845.1 enoyl-CoA hydratase/isomerase family protein [Myxococcus sp. CA051A]TQF10009.1 enoyl-CoA hydratase/isomerase family protein [Myxococcus llanfairpwllgwyngyllgogerychwyrndrobwllllantysiliogogogochensis]